MTIGFFSLCFPTTSKFSTVNIITHVLERKSLFFQSRRQLGEERFANCKRDVTGRKLAEPKGYEALGYIGRTMTLQPEDLDAFLVVSLISMLTPGKSLNSLSLSFLWRRLLFPPPHVPTWRGFPGEIGLSPCVTLDLMAQVTVHHNLPGTVNAFSHRIYSSLAFHSQNCPSLNNKLMWSAHSWRLCPWESGYFYTVSSKSGL